MADRGDGNPKADERLAGDGSRRRDFLSRFIEASAKDPEFFPQERVLALTVANM